MTQNPKLLFVTTKPLPPIIPKAVGHPPNSTRMPNYYLLSLISYLLSLIFYLLSFIY